MNNQIEISSKNTMKISILDSKIIKLIFGKIIPFTLIAIFIIRLFSYQTVINEYIKFEPNEGYNPLTISKGQATIGLIAIWLHYAAILVVIMKSFFDFKILRNIVKFVTIPIFIFNGICFSNIITLFVGPNNSTVLSIAYILEIVFGILLSVYSILHSYKEKNNFKDIMIMLGIFLILMIPVLPSYFVQFIFGYGRSLIQIKGFGIYHRLYLYIGIIIPVVLYFLLRNKSEEVIRFSLIYLSIATLVVFVVNYDYTSLAEPWAWPFHLCNTAMFIVPLCLIFRMNRLFYFTYFINVFGALMAMLMPNYDASTNIFSTRIFVFWYNHWIAFFMPLLLVALKQFKRPHIKQFYWSMVWFLGYFIIALFFNVYFTALGHEVDYFFLNSDFIADKLGTWAENIFKSTAILKVGGMELEFHPLYQIIFFCTYVLIGLAIWFVYAEFFRVADSHYELHMRLKKIKQDKYAISSIPSQQRREQMMNENKEARLELTHFSKRYGSSKHYAVEDANLVVEKGEIFGFLGPNGAGKSTIIKSLVGIQPITEGNMEICGYDVALQPVEAKYNIGYVPDHYALYEKLSGREYINYIADIYEVSQEDRDERINKYVKLFELEASIDSPIKTYSHGMKQKITIMSALVHNPKVWILDEPLTGLDPNSIYQVKECMKIHASEGNIVFFSSHLIDIVEKLCQKIAIIKHGKIQCVKTVEEIENSGTTLEQFYLSVIGNNEVE